MNKPYCKTCEAAKKENQRLKEQLEEAVDCLNFYADADNWEDELYCVGYSPGGYGTGRSTGEKARKFLAKYRGEG